MIKNISYQNIFNITKKELRGYFDNPTAYIIITVFLLLWEFLFFKNVFLVGESSLRLLFDLLPWLFLFLIPAITMGSISQEKNEGTLEFLLTHPLKDEEMIMGKFLAAVVFAVIILSFIFPIALSLNAFGGLDWGVVFGQYFGSISFASALISVGIFVSSFFASQVSALFVSIVICFFLIIAGFEIVTVSLPSFIASFFERLSTLSHFESMSRGVIDLRDIWYFISFIFIFLSLTYLQMLKRRFGNQKYLYHSFQLGISLFIGIAILVNVVGSYIPGRIDLTKDQLFTLTQTTKKTLSNLKDVVNVTLYASSDLPAQFQPVLRETKDTLKDYQTYGKGNISVSIKDPSGNDKIAQEANSSGIQQMRFNVVGQEELQMKQGFLGIVVSYAGKSEIIPFLKDTKDLECQLTSFIRGLTIEKKKKLAFLTGHGEKDLQNDYQAFSQELKKQFDIKPFTIEVTEGKKSIIKPIPSDTDVLVVAGPTQKIEDKSLAEISKYLDNGGSALFLIDGTIINTQYLVAQKNQNNLSDFLKNYGAEVKQDLAYDLRSNQTVNMNSGMFSIFVPYPLWTRAITSKISSRIESVVLPWPSSILINNDKLKEKGLSATTILSTTQYGGLQSDNFLIDPQKQLPQNNLSQQPLAVQISNEKSSTEKKSPRIILIGNSNLFSDQFIKNSPENIAFGMETASWLSQEESLAGIQIKNKTERKLLFDNNTQMTLIKYGNLFLAFLIPVGFGLFRTMRRRSLRNLTYRGYNKY